MSSTLSRRQFAAGLVAGLGSARAFASSVLPPIDGRTVAPSEFQGGGAAAAPNKRPVVISSPNGFTYGATAEAYSRMAAGGDTLDAVIAGVGKVEADPRDMSVGYGALPDEDGVVTNDACCIHGPTMQMGAVGCLAGFMHTARVAQAVFQNTDQVFLVGAGAARFAETVGAEKSPGLTERARQRWLLWKESRSLRDMWGPGLDDPRYDQWQQYKTNGNPPASALEPLAQQIGIPRGEWTEAFQQVLHPPHGTINCLAVNEKGEVSGVTTTSGMAFKVPGRCGDSPVLGAGCYVDGEIGGAGSTGRGEENIRICGGHTILEQMRNGRTPREACLEALRRVQHLFRAYPERLAKVDLQFYAVRVDGAYAAATLWGPAAATAKATPFAVHDGTNRTEEMAFLLRRLA